MAMVEAGGLSIDKGIHDLIVGTAGANAEQVLNAFGDIVRKLAPVNDQLLADRDKMQQQIDHYFTKSNPANLPFDAKDYTQFLKDIGYIVQPKDDKFSVTTQNVDPEFTTAGPQLVCPVFIGEDEATNARYPLNAVNARWGSLYDAVYGKSGDNNIIDEKDGKEFRWKEDERGNRIKDEDGNDIPVYNSTRGEAVTKYVNEEALDKFVPLDGASHADVTAYKAKNGELVAMVGDREVGLKEPERFAGHIGNAETPSSILLEHHGLGIELKIDRNDKLVGSKNKSGIKDVLLESALTSIIDLEDATSAVDAKDKILAYKNVIGLLKGDLTANVENGDGSIVKRTLKKDRAYTRRDGAAGTMPARSVMLFRRVGLHMHTDAVQYNGKDIPEGFLDTLMIALASLHDLKKKPGDLRNSKTGSVYIVMPKQHGPEEVKLTVELFSRIEKALGLEENTLKIGIMDEEQRTSVNLKESIRAAKDRIVFINTGFLDRTGDLIHTAMEAGPMDTKAGMKAAPWLDAYERSNMQVGLNTELEKHGQVGKGMWPQNRNPAGLLATKAEHPKAGATTAWVPDPKMATLHALHYHQVNVQQAQEALLDKGNPAINKSEILEAPLLTQPLTPEQKEELAYGYSQSILGYVVRWVNQGVGCSSVPDYTGTSLMEDRATLRIGSQLLSNWLEHKVITEDDLNKGMARAAATVDKQNEGDKTYTPLVGNYDGPAFQAAMQLIHEGTHLPNGYVEPMLHAARREVKAKGAYRGGSEPRYIPTKPGTSPSEAVGKPIEQAQERRRA